MPTSYIQARTLGNGEMRYVVRYRDGGRYTQARSGGSFRDQAEAEARRDLIRVQLNVGGPVWFPNRVKKRRPVAVTRWLYFVQMGNDGPIKIGETTDVRLRIRLMQTGNPDRLVLLASIPWKAGLEAAIHAAFDVSRLTGEWFQPDPDLLSYIASIQAQTGNGGSAR